MQMPAAKASDPRPKKCWLLTLHPPVNACRMVTCVTPCQCLTLLMLASNASSPCQRVSNGYLCQPLPVMLLPDPIKKSRKMQLPAAKASGPRPKKC